MSTQPIIVDPSQVQSIQVDPSEVQAVPSAAAPPSAASRGVSSYLSGLGITSNEAAKQFFTHPIKTLMDSIEAQGQLAQKAKDAYERGDYLGAVQHGLNYLIPFMGQQTDQAGNQLKSGDIAGGVGRTLGAATMLAAGSPEVQSAAGDVATAAASKTAQAVKAGVNAVKDVGTAENLGTAVGGAIGAKVGHMMGEPISGGFAGAVLGRKFGAAFGKRLAQSSEQAAPEAAAKAELDATGENKPFAGGMDEAALAPRTVVTDPQTGQPEFSDVVAAKQQTAAPKITQAQVERQLESALGAQKLQPGVSLRNQPAAQAAAAANPPKAPLANVQQAIQESLPPAAESSPKAPLGNLPQAIKLASVADRLPAGVKPEDLTPVENSSLLSAYHYDPAAKQFTAVLNNGETYTHGEVEPDHVAAFEGAKSKGTAWTKAIKQAPGTVQVLHNGEPVIPGTMRSATGEVIPKSQAGMQDLTSILQQSLEQARRKKITAQ